MQDFDHYMANLGGQKIAIHPNSPQPGFYRRRMRKGGPWVAGAIWSDGGKLVCRVGNEMFDPVEQWTWLAKNPVPEAEVRHWFQHGDWPEATVVELKPALPNVPVDPYAALMVDVEAACEAAERLAVVEIDDAVADTIGNCIADLRKAKSRCDAMHKIEKAPSLAAGRAVDKRFKPHVTLIEGHAEVLKSRLAKWHDKRRAAILADVAAAGTDGPGDEPVAPFDHLKVGGETGRKIGLNVKTHCHVNDHAAALAFFAAYDEVREVVGRLATQFYAATQQCPPGCELKEETVVR